MARKEYPRRADQLLAGKSFNPVAGVGAEQLVGYMQALTRLDQDHGRISREKREIFQEMQALGYDKSAMRMVMIRQRERLQGLTELSPPPPRVREAVELYESLIAAAREKKKRAL